MLLGRDSDGKLTTYVRKTKDRVRYIEEHQRADFPLWQLAYARIDETTAYWVNRPTTNKGTRCARQHARDITDFKNHCHRELGQAVATVNRALVTLRRFFGVMLTNAFILQYLRYDIELNF
jgi:hypothetical protein